MVIGVKYCILDPLNFYLLGSQLCLYLIFCVVLVFQCVVRHWCCFSVLVCCTSLVQIVVQRGKIEQRWKYSPTSAIERTALECMSHDRAHAMSVVIPMLPQLALASIASTLALSDSRVVIRDRSHSMRLNAVWSNAQDTIEHTSLWQSNARQMIKRMRDCDRSHT